MKILILCLSISLASATINNEGFELEEYCVDCGHEDIIEDDEDVMVDDYDTDVERF